MTQDWTLVIHGGSGSMTRANLGPDGDAAGRAGLAAALEAGSAILRDGGSALDAVEAAVRVLEEDPHFNAGRGSVFSWDGVNELDAAIMDGRTRDAGAVTGVTTTRAPVSLARAVLADGRHVLLSGAGADGFARTAGLEQVAPDWFAIPERRRQLDEIKAGGGFDADMKYGTVGAVARDRHGHVAAATSTGGLTAKRWGRIGDTPLIGAGTYADDRAAAISCTGAGEVFIRAAAAHEIAARVRIGGALAVDAAGEVIADIGALGGKGGTIVVGSDGSGGWAFNTPAMYRAIARSGDEPRIAIYGDEE
ncbi:isoaspartyl peptidase/L-asparaginase family protein [Sphingomonas nostoxanthinifaciens]|uniref:isoaspartyl peptidase/L-asparaginase family protein n=1 Tax=Sphingomonas nostoxanthinifaciens TaxID=2872652 RepID=UPI001CC1DEBA|nr:isoaspartyl peptidase/L-asparaginase [Sphingomonas nostoxanthinifaciens]UAK26315.1 isoaspartyl peptidase/L-asparaginase [Sphingomonas nostoxanthinifaciens]